MSSSTTIEYLRSLHSVRERSSKVFALGEQGKLDFWDLDLSKQGGIVDFMLKLIERDYANDFESIPPHGRWQHFVTKPQPGSPPSSKPLDRIDLLINSWSRPTSGSPVPQLEIGRRLIDLFVVSVLLDAGAGNQWKYKEKGSWEGRDETLAVGRSEGLALASLDMFRDGLFSGIDGQPFQVDAVGLSRISASEISNALQVSDSNPITGIEGRAALLVKLGQVMTDPKVEAFFKAPGSDERRPGHIIDYLLHHESTTRLPSPSTTNLRSVPMPLLWSFVLDGLNVWPSSPKDRIHIDGVNLGDVWACQSLKRHNAGGEGEYGHLCPFHKLSQWLTYSLIDIFEKVLGWQFEGKDMLTGLPEYRNGGLLVDFKLLNMRTDAVLSSLSLPVPSPPPSPLELPPLPADHSALVEFRAITVIMLDRISDELQQRTGKTLELAQILQAGTWQAGREIAAKLRPDDMRPPINILSDGTVF